MAVAVVSNQMALRLHALYNLLVSLYVLSHQKKGCPDIPLFQPVQQFFRAILIWSVVKGQSHTFPFQSLGPVQGIPSLPDPGALVGGHMGRHLPPDRMDKAAQQQKVRYADSCQEF